MSVHVLPGEPAPWKTDEPFTRNVPTAGLTGYVYDVVVAGAVEGRATMPDDAVFAIVEDTGGGDGVGVGVGVGAGVGAGAAASTFIVAKTTGLDEAYVIVQDCAPATVAIRHANDDPGIVAVEFAVHSTVHPDGHVIA